MAAALLGLASGVHCLGMCGGIVGAFGAQRPVRITLPRRSRLEWRVPLAFNAGRIASYAAAGAVAGALGGGAGAVFGFWLDWQLALQIAASLLLILAGVQLAGFAAPLALLESRWEASCGGISSRSPPASCLSIRPDARSLPELHGDGCRAEWFTQRSRRPCSPEAPLAGASVMLGFGLGTLPWLLAAGVGFARWRVALTRPGLAHRFRQSRAWFRCIRPGARRCSCPRRYAADCSASDRRAASDRPGATIRWNRAGSDTETRQIEPARRLALVCSKRSWQATQRMAPRFAISLR